MSAWASWALKTSGGSEPEMVVAMTYAPATSCQFGVASPFARSAAARAALSTSSWRFCQSFCSSSTHSTDFTRFIALRTLRRPSSVPSTVASTLTTPPISSSAAFLLLWCSFRRATTLSASSRSGLYFGWFCATSRNFSSAASIASKSLGFSRIRRSSASFRSLQSARFCFSAASCRPFFTISVKNKPPATTNAITPPMLHIISVCFDIGFTPTLPSLNPIFLRSDPLSAGSSCGDAALRMRLDAGPPGVAAPGARPRRLDAGVPRAGVRGGGAASSAGSSSSSSCWGGGTATFLDAGAGAGFSLVELGGGGLSPGEAPAAARGAAPEADGRAATAEAREAGAAEAGAPAFAARASATQVGQYQNSPRWRARPFCTSVGEIWAPQRRHSDMVKLLGVPGLSGAAGSVVKAARSPL
ncbi:MAG: hypothetical protein IT452_11740 [Planctomycetia bacterium]|nr:hypothetical protein [Planctomycetia bacterium]